MACCTPTRVSLYWFSSYWIDAVNELIAATGLQSVASTPLLLRHRLIAPYCTSGMLFRTLLEGEAARDDKTVDQFPAFIA
jgi:hypothetical protein